MKRVITIFSLILVCVTFTSVHQVYAQAKKPDWNAFSKNLTANLLSSNPGVRQSAMQLMAKYGDKLRLNDEAVYELVRIYRWQKDVRLRQLALVTLHKVKDKWAMDFLRRSLEFEDNPVLKHTIAAIVLDYYGSKPTGP